MHTAVEGNGKYAVIKVLQVRFVGVYVEKVNVV